MIEVSNLKRKCYLDKKNIKNKQKVDKRMKSQMLSESTDITNKNQQIEGNRQSEFKELHIRHSESVHQTV